MIAKPIEMEANGSRVSSAIEIVEGIVIFKKETSITNAKYMPPAVATNS